MIGNRKGGKIEKREIRSRAYPLRRTRNIILLIVLASLLSAITLLYLSSPAITSEFAKQKVLAEWSSNVGELEGYGPNTSIREDEDRWVITIDLQRQVDNLVIPGVAQYAVSRKTGEMTCLKEPLSELITFLRASSGVQISEPEGDNLNIYDNKVLVPLDGDIFISLKEELTENGANLILDLVTVNTYSNFNYAIIVEENQQDNKIEMLVRGIYIPEILLPACGPAHASVNLGKISGTFYFTMEYENSVDVYGLIISHNEIYFIPISTKFTQLTETHLLRVPENTIWVECWLGSGPEPADVNKYALLRDNFFTLLEALGATKFTPEEGTYTEFSFNRCKDRVYIYLGEIQELESLVESFYPYFSHISLRINTWQGHFIW